MSETTNQLQIYDSFQRAKRVFTPLDPSGNKVKMYVCGVTVYDMCHVGHGRTSVAFDVIARHLRYLGYDLSYVRNITDIDDKIINKAASESTTPEAIAQLYTEAMLADERWLGNTKPDISPQASQSIAQIIGFIQSLLNISAAYVAATGDIYFRVRSANNYGALGNKKINELRDPGRIEHKKEKEDPLDFALWKAADDTEVGWDSPWGRGRPGWHIECSAMIHDCLGEHIDIHGGGSDLVFPHHTNEIAQSEARFGAHLAKYWMHSGSVMVDRDKMSKSLDNFITLEDLKEQYSGQLLRFFYLQSHYRSPIQFSMSALGKRVYSWERITNCYRRYAEDIDISSTPANPENEYLRAFDAAMNDDFNTPEALAVIFEMVREINLAGHPAASRELSVTLMHLLDRLGLVDAEDVGAPIVDTVFIEEQIELRKQARAESDWETADHIRDQLLRLGILIEDNVDGSTTWRLERT